MEETAQVDKGQACTCGRVHTHCHFCPSVNLYPMKIRSMQKSMALGYEITVYRCKKCGRETDDTVPCTVPPERTDTNFKSYQKPEKAVALPPWGLSLPGSPERHRLLAEWVVEMQAKKRWGPVQVYVEAQKAGWQLEAFPEVDEDVVRECKDLSLWPTEGAGVGVMSTQSGGNIPNGPADGVTSSEAPSSQPVSLDDIIEAMQKEQK